MAEQPLSQSLAMNQLPPSRRKLAEHEHNNHVVYPITGTTLEQMLNPKYWAHVAREMRLYDKIEAIVEDGSMEYEFRVLSVGKNEVFVALRHSVELGQVPQSTSLPSDYKVEWSGPHSKHRVKRGNDVIRDKFDTAEAARQWLVNHINSQKAA